MFKFLHQHCHCNEAKLKDSNTPRASCHRLQTQREILLFMEYSSHPLLERRPCNIINELNSFVSASENLVLRYPVCRLLTFDLRQVS